MRPGYSKTAVMTANGLLPLVVSTLAAGRGRVNFIAENRGGLSQSTIHRGNLLVNELPSCARFDCGYEGPRARG